MSKIERRVLRDDGTVEVFFPHRYRSGKYIIAPRRVMYRHVADKRIEVETEEELVALARTGKYCIRMSKPGENHPCLIAPEGYVVHG